MQRKIFKLKLWRKGRDLNPRWSCPHNGFRGRRIQPLCHLSVNDFSIIAQVGGKNQRIFYKIILTNVFFCKYNCRDLRKESEIELKI